MVRHFFPVALEVLPHMSPRPRTLALTAAALAVTVVAASQLPQGGGEHPAYTPTAQRSIAPGQQATAALGRVTPQAKAEIDRVLAQTGATGTNARTKASAIAASTVQCADFEGQTYCLGQGWTTDSEAQVQARVTTELNRLARTTPVERTGDLDAVAQLQRRATMAPLQRERLDRAELTMAARSVAKVWLLRHELDGTPLPKNFLAEHPEVRVDTRTTTARTTSTTYPASDAILDPADVMDQTRSYWCGPTTMQMIAWGWNGWKSGQLHWSRRLGTTTSGTAISEMVRVVNADTGWDGPDYAGAYIVLDIGNYSFYKWYRLIQRHITDYHAPVVMHPVLKKEFYSYIDDDASGHFQVGRGYRTRVGKPNLVGLFEPWNQQRFDPSEPFISRVQWYSAYKQYRANLAHFQHNIGV